MHRFRHSIYSLLMLLAALLLHGCSEPDSPEQQIRNTIEAAKQAAESRDLSDFRDIIADDFRDARGHDKHTVSRMAAGYFLRNKNIHLFTRVNDIRFPTADLAEAQVYVAMTAQFAADLDSLLNLRADLYQFDLRFIKRQDDWLLENARWKRLRRDDVTGH